jgi:tRNA(Ile)-lysidine synthase
MLILREEVLHSYGISASDGILIALSGGADSVALLLEMNRFRKEGKLRTIAAAHLNHGIRGEEALRDAAFCRALCQRERIPFYEKTTDVPSAAKQRGVSLETAARSERYAFLNEVAKKLEFRWIATAHHRDDQAETLLLHLLRGCGTDGLAGMQECSGNLIRPFLRIPKSEILNYLAERNEPFCTDSTNSSPEHLRNRIRQEVLPLLNTLRPNASGALANTAALVAIDAAYWKEQADRIYRSNPTRFELAELPESLRMRVLKRFVPYDDYDRNDFLTLNELLHSETGTQRHL